ncbi:membrane protein [Cytophagales bacterium WSM2-2]|nr:membrane protein [Cytophagales bacterium WSM2-2]
MRKYSVAIVISFFFATTALGQNIVSVPFKLVNSEFDEQNPVISPDGKAIYFTLARHPQNTNGKKDLGDIWISLKVNNQWTAPVHGGSAINDAAYNAVLGFSPDGSQLFLSNHFSKNGGIASTQGISASRKTDFGWSIPENISVPYFLNRSEFLNGMINSEETIFIFSADSYGTRGVEDIYVSLKKEGRWSEPINLGSSINTTFQELTPSLSADGKTIYFSSNGRQGLGGFDVYSSTRLDDTWTSWSEPVNVASVNSEARDLFYRVESDGLTLFTTTRNSDGYGDIRALADSARLPLDTSRIVDTRQRGASSRLSVYGKTSDSKTGGGISAKLSFKADSTFSSSSARDGKFSIEVARERSYTIEIQAAGYVNLFERLNSGALNVSSLELNFKLQPIEVGTVVNLKNILFYMGTTSLLEESYPELDVVVDFLKSNPKIEIQLEGHTDNRGDAKKNVILSQQRVDRIKNYLVAKGIPARKIKGKGFGGSKPIAANDTEEARKLNRRVEFVIVKD